MVHGILPNNFFSFAHEEPPVLMFSYKAPDFEETVIDKCLASDYKWCTKRMEIDLIAMGLDVRFAINLRYGDGHTTHNASRYINVH